MYRTRVERPRTLRFFGLSCLLFCLGFAVAECRGQEESAASHQSVLASANSPIKLSVGFDGKLKLGHVCPLRIEIAQEVRDEARMVHAFTADGDGVAIKYQLPLEPQPSLYRSVVWLPIKIGRANVPIRVQVLDTVGSVLAADEVSVDELEVLDSDQPFALAIGSSMGIEDLFRRSADGSDSNFSYAVVSDPSQLPPSARDYSAFDIVILACQDLGLMKSMGPRWDAIEAWIEAGGGCILSLSSEVANSLASSGSEEDDLVILRRLLPGPVQGTGDIADPGVLESLVATATDDPLGRFRTALFDVDGRSTTGNLDLAMTDTLSRKTAWWTTRPLGQGTVRVVASDLDSDAFAEWDARKLLWERLVSPYWGRDLLENKSTQEDSRDSSYLGYNDLVGQLRASLDLFGGIREVSFSEIAAILIGILLLIGPLDYFLSVKWIKRPDLSWYFAGSVLLLSTIALTWYCVSVRPSGVLVNTAQIVDIDATTGKLRGSMWSHVYSGVARTVNVRAEATGAVSGTNDQDAQPTNPTGVFLDWQGLPGGGLGGLNAQLSTDRGMPAYSATLETGDTTSLNEVGIGAGGTKCLFGSWNNRLDMEDSFQLSEIPGVDQLSGEFRNPLNVDIRDAVLFYHNWFYRLNSRIPAGDRVVISSDTIPKDIARKLNERTLVQDKVASTKWNPADRESVDRLLELMMFHKAASGRNYTALHHRYQPYLDHSNLLSTDTAFLVCRLDEPLAKIKVGGVTEDKLDVEQKMDRTWCRIAIPIAKRDR
ncbi:MAG: hypothetical protein AAGG44_15640 [Planctomycetota bacterium]